MSTLRSQGRKGRQSMALNSKAVLQRRSLLGVATACKTEYRSPLGKPPAGPAAGHGVRGC